MNKVAKTTGIILASTAAALFAVGAAAADISGHSSYIQLADSHMGSDTNSCNGEDSCNGNDECNGMDENNGNGNDECNGEDEDNGNG